MKLGNMKRVRELASRLVEAKAKVRYLRDTPQSACYLYVYGCSSGGTPKPGTSVDIKFKRHPISEANPHAGGVRAALVAFVEHEIQDIEDRLTELGVTGVS